VRRSTVLLPTRAGAKAPTCMMIAIDDALPLGYVYAKTSDTHTTDDWVDFFSHVHAAEVMYNHKILAIKLDRAPEFDCERLKRRVESYDGWTDEHVSDGRRGEPARAIRLAAQTVFVAGLGWDGPSAEAPTAFDLQSTRTGCLTSRPRRSSTRRTSSASHCRAQAPSASRMPR
jgi:hypothetical protein